MNDVIRTLQFEKEQLEARLRLLEDKIESDNRQISEYDHELRQAKRLLKAAVDDMSKEADCGICLHDDDGGCPIEVAACKFKWRYADEAKRLLKGE